MQTNSADLGRWIQEIMSLEEEEEDARHAKKSEAA